MNDCKKCNGTGWVCENHLEKEWENCGVDKCDGAGKNCYCNPNGEFPPDTATIASIFDNETIVFH